MYLNSNSSSSEVVTLSSKVNLCLILLPVLTRGRIFMLPSITIWGMLGYLRHMCDRQCAETSTSLRAAGYVKEGCLFPGNRCLCLGSGIRLLIRISWLPMQCLIHWLVLLANNVWVYGCFVVAASVVLVKQGYSSPSKRGLWL